MFNVSIKKILLGLFVLTLCSANTGLLADTETKKAKVAFISVANDTEAYWADIHALAKAAAADLGVDLEILLSHRNHIAARELADEVSKRKDKPDYAIVVGEKLIASSSIETLTESGIKVLMFGSLTKEEKAVIGEPREKKPNYIGKISIDDYTAGYLSAELMVKTAIEKKLHDEEGYINLLVLEGVRKTPFNSNRVRGLNDILKEYPKVRIIQSVHTDWTYEDAGRIAPQMLQRHAQHKIAGFWCANSALAKGASDAMKNLGKAPGVDFITVGTDWGTAAVESVSSGDVLGISGGHVAAAAWIVTLIHDYHNGIDFDDSVYLNKVTMMDKAFSIKFLENFKEGDWDAIDFTKYSKAENADLKQYELSFNAIFDDL